MSVELVAAGMCPLVVEVEGELWEGRWRNAGGGGNL